jgi:D-3-phosphoglycerate dehydrogenase / 2-oxoglutarate reductase
MQNKGTILIIDDVHPYLVNNLPSIGYTVHYMPSISAQEITAIVGNYVGLVVRSKIKITKLLIDAATQLKFIGRAGSGLEIIDTQYAQAKGIVCFNTPDANRDAVAEQAVGMLLSLLANIYKAANEVKNFVWDREGNRGYELGNLTVGIIGYGNTGSAFAQKLRGFGCKVIAYDKYKSGFGNEHVQEVDMKTLFAQADVLSLHIPLTEETKGLVTLKYLNSFYKNIYLLNLARGKIVVTADIIKALQTNKLRGIALDVLENENLNEYTFDERLQLSNLTSFNNVIITSHIGGWTHESYYKISVSLFKKIEQL